MFVAISDGIIDSDIWLLPLPRSTAVQQPDTEPECACTREATARYVLKSADPFQDVTIQQERSSVPEHGIYD